MKTKRFIRITALTLAFILCFRGASVNYASAKNIYFAGIYKGKGGTLRLWQYSSPENSAYGKDVGGFEFKGFKNKHKNTSGELYRKGKNKYQTREGFITVIVKKKSVVVKGGINDWSTGKFYSLKGTYKLKKRTPKP